MGRVAACFVVCFVAGCHPFSFGVTARPSSPSKLCHDPSLTSGDLCMQPSELETLLRTEPLPVRAVRPTNGGTSGARLVWLELHHPSEILIVRAKWKPAPRDGEALNNVPRRELAAYAIQKLFLPPDEYVVPPTVARCLPSVFHDSRFGGHDRPFQGTSCVLGTLSYWVENLTHQGVRDLDRFARDPSYRRTVANLNVLTYIIDHRDTRSANFMITRRSRRPRAFAVDNGLSFSGIRNPLAWFRPDWAKIIVPAVPKDTIDRLRAVDRAAIEKLAVVTELRRTSDGLLEEVPPTAPLDENAGVRVADDTVQLGLTRKEIDGVVARIRELIARVDSGDLQIF